MTGDSTSQIRHSRHEAPGSYSALARPASTIFSIGCPLAAFLIPLKLSLAYATLAPLIILWWVSFFTNAQQRSFSIAERRTLVPLLLFFLMCAISSLVGVDFRHGLSALISLFFFAGTIPVFLRYAPLTQTAAALLAGQTIASAHSFLDAAFPGTFPNMFQGKVTESGQLAVSAVLAISLMWHFAAREGRMPATRRSLALGGALLLLLLATSFRAHAALPPNTTVAMCAALLACFLASVRRSLRASGAEQRVCLLASVQIPLLVCALLVNLKRGPWLGVLVGCALFFAVYAKRVLAGLVAASCIAAISLEPIRDRLLASYEHFTISGGRSTMWRIALDLASEYPLGIGYHNSGIVRTLAPEIPPELKHFHSNVLNIVAETGWLGATFFAWFIVTLLRSCFVDRRNILAVGMGCAIVSWQTAGLVEYNIGDSEVLILVWMLVGSMFFSMREEPSEAAGATSEVA